MILVRTARYKLLACPACRLWTIGLWRCFLFHPSGNYLWYILREQFLMLFVHNIKGHMLFFFREFLLLRFLDIHCACLYVGSLFLFLCLLGSHHIWDLKDWYILLMRRVLVNLNFFMSRSIIILFNFHKIYIILDDDLIFMASHESLIQFICNWGLIILLCVLLWLFFYFSLVKLGHLLN